MTDKKSTETDSTLEVQNAGEKAAMPSLGNWFMTFLVMDIPIAGFITLLVWAFGKNTDEVKRGFARARLLYKILFVTVSLILLYILFQIATPKLEQLIDLLQSS